MIQFSRMCTWLLTQLSHITIQPIQTPILSFGEITFTFQIDSKICSILAYMDILSSNFTYVCLNWQRPPKMKYVKCENVKRVSCDLVALKLIVLYCELGWNKVKLLVCNKVVPFPWLLDRNGWYRDCFYQCMCHLHRLDAFSSSVIIQAAC